MRNTNVDAGWPDQERSPEVFGSSLISSQPKSYKPGSAAPELTHRQSKKLAYLFAEPLAKIAPHGSRPTCRAAFVFLTSDAYLPSRRCVSTQRTACRTISALVVNSIFSLM